MIDSKIADHNSQAIRQKIGRHGTISKQDFWKVKKKLAPHSVEVPSSLTNATGDQITDPINIRREYHNEFQHRLRKREIKSGLEDYESLQNKLCMARLKAASKVKAPDFSINEIKHAVSELKSGKCSDPTGLIREVFKNAGDALLHSICDMANSVKRSKTIPSEWSKIWIKTLKKKKESFKKLNNYRGIFIVPILSIIFEKLLKNRITPTLKQHMSNFQNGGAKGKGVVDNLFILRALFDHAKYLNKELWLTFYDIEKCFDSLWLEDCMNSLWENGVKDDTLSLIYYLNEKANVVVKTPFGDTDPISFMNIVKQGTVLGPVLNNVSLDRVCKESYSHHLGSVEIRSLEFVDDIADPNSDRNSAIASNRIIEQIQHEKRISFSFEKCELLKMNSKAKQGNIMVNGENIKTVDTAKYLGDKFNSKGNYTDLCKDRVDRAKGSTFELIALCKEVKFGTRQIENMLILYQSVFLPRLIHNCESWSNMTPKDYKALQSAQLLYLRNVMEVSRATPTVALFLELGILPIRFEIEKRQLFFFKRLLDKDKSDPVQSVYFEQLKYVAEQNWANYIQGLRHTYNLPLSDDNVRQMTLEQWKVFVKTVIWDEAFMQLMAQCKGNKKTMHLTYHSVKRAEYLEKLEPNLARIVFKARVRMFDIKVNYKNKYSTDLSCPFCKMETETFDHLFECISGLYCPSNLRSIQFSNFCNEASVKNVRRIAKFLLKYSKYREDIL